MKIKIKRMPTKKMLEDFVKGSSEGVRVYFDVEKGIFKRISNYVIRRS